MISQALREETARGRAMTTQCFRQIARSAPVVVVLLLAAVTASAGDGGTTLGQVVGAVLAHKRWLVIAAAVLSILLGVWLAARRKKRALLGLAAVVLVGCLAFLVLELNQRYPNQGLLSLERYRDSVAILLGTDIRLARFKPEPVLKVDRERVPRAAYSAIDVHFHLESLSPTIDAERLVQAMDAAGIAKIVDLGGLPEDFKQAAKNFTARYPDRIVQFVKPDIAAVVADKRGFEAGVAEQVRWIDEAARLGAQGVKVSKSLGTGQIDQDGHLVPVDDPRLDPLWARAGQLGMPVLIHTGEPAAFSLPADEHNERYDELRASPDAGRYGKPPSREELFAQRERLLSRHPETNFIGAHFGMQEDDLAQVAALLDKYPNYYVDIAAVIQALGRQPITAREFFIKYQDRVLFGTDGGWGLVTREPGWTPERLYRDYFEFLETSNEYFEYPFGDTAHQGRWRIYGIDLPNDVLEKVYFRNAEKLIPTRAAVLAGLGAAGVARVPAAAAK